MSEDKPHRTGLLGRILNKEDAIKTIKQASYVIIVMAFIYAFIGFLTEPALITDGIFYCILGVLLLWLKSRVVSIITLIFSLLALLLFILNKTGVVEEGGSLGGIFVIILLIASAKAVEGTFKFRGKYKVDTF
ncbi:MAG: hypothetical protein JW927_13475 [Deltaproteobacteria bacterium]|nr:hypothetical protein [Deltaproteobacteria bacterium]